MTAPVPSSGLSAARVEEIEARANAAARGPWTLDDAESWDVVVWSSEPDPRDDDPEGTELAMNLGADVVRVGSPCGTHDIANGTFIAHARTDIPDLLAEVRRLQGELDAAREFKRYVHARLDEAGVPHDPDPQHNAECGCRIGGRLTYVFDQLASAREETARLDTAQRLLSGVDFAYGDPESPRSVVVLDLPNGVRVGADFRAFLDAARSRSHPGETADA